jgi:16S rRNA (cytosine1402-N4)-methyltransferase
MSTEKTNSTLSKLSTDSNDSTSTNQNVHIPVLLNEVISNLTDSDSDNSISAESSLKEKTYNFFDGTLGGGGYTNLLYNTLSSKTGVKDFEIYACDLDDEAISNFEARDKITLKCANFANYIQEFEDGFFDGIMVDLGFSSNQLEYSGRGFSYQNDDEELDLRYNQESGQPLWQHLAYIRDVKTLGKQIYEYSGEELSFKIAHKIMDYKSAGGKIFTVGDLKKIVIEAIPAKFQKNKFSILSRVWQSFRIIINKEFEALGNFLPTAAQKLKVGGKLAVVCFHSLEDKLVTKFMREVSRMHETDEYGNKEQFYKLVTKQAILPSIQEITDNSRSRSATLRIVQRLKID